MLYGFPLFDWSGLAHREGWGGFRYGKPWGQGCILLAEGVMLALPWVLAGRARAVSRLPSPTLQGLSWALVLAVSLWAWWRAVVRARTLDGTPVDRIASTAQGYASLTGRGQPLQGHWRVREPLTGQPCLWYRVRYSSVRPGVGAAFDSDESEASFLLDDGSGATCAVDTEGAEIGVRRHQVEIRDGTRIEQWCLRPGDRIYVLGEFTTLGSIASDTDTRRQTGELLELWKADRPDLLRRFDLDGNGEIDAQEWNLARAAARRDVLRQQRQAQAAPEAHVMRKPRDGRPYLITDRDPRTLARHWRRWAFVHAAAFIAAAAGLAWIGAGGGIDT